MQPFEQLEVEFARWAKVQNAVACNSGTSALHLALEALELPRGSEVIVPEFTMVACARAVVLADLKPVFVDCGQDLLISVGKLFEAVNNRTSAIMAVHIYGRGCNMNAIHEIAGHSVRVIEDCAEAHGVRPHVDTDASCWSFYQNKIVAGEEGGIVSFKKPLRADIAKELRCVGQSETHNFLHRPRGLSYRMSNANARLILLSLSMADHNIGKRRRVEEWYAEYLPQSTKMPIRNAPWVYDLTCPSPSEVVPRLNQVGIQARYAFRPMSEQAEFYAPECNKLLAYQKSREIIYLPIRPSMVWEDVQSTVAEFNLAAAVAEV